LIYFSASFEERFRGFELVASKVLLECHLQCGKITASVSMNAVTLIALVIVQSWWSKYNGGTLLQCHIPIKKKLGRYI